MIRNLPDPGFAAAVLFAFGLLFGVLAALAYTDGAVRPALFVGFLAGWFVCSGAGLSFVLIGFARIEQ